MPSSAESSPVLLCGYYGEHNLGDDALLEVLLQQLPANCRPLVTARDGEALGQRLGLETVDRRSVKAVLAALPRCRALVLGGGSLLQDATSFTSLIYYGLLILAARVQGKPVLLWAQGLGPLRRRRSRLLVRWLLTQVTAASWRDPESADLARRLGGSSACVGSDPVWAMPPQPWRGRGGPIILCWRPVSQLQGVAWMPYLKAVAALAREQDRAVVWLPFHADQDTHLLGTLAQQGLLPDDLALRSQVVRPDSPREALQLLSSAALVIAMRLHGLILAAQAGSPVAALSYDPKVAAAAAAIGCPCRDLAADGAPGLDQELLQSWRGVFEHPPVAETLQRQRNQAEVHRGVLSCLVE